MTIWIPSLEYDFSESTLFFSCFVYISRKRPRKPNQLFAASDGGSWRWCALAAGFLARESLRVGAPAQGPRGLRV